MENKSGNRAAKGRSPTHLSNQNRVDALDPTAMEVWNHTTNMTRNFGLVKYGSQSIYHHIEQKGVNGSPCLTPHSVGKKGPISPLILTPEVITIPEERDGVTTSPAVGNGLEVRHISVALEDPSPGTSLAPIGLLIGVNDRKLVLKIITEQPLSGDRPEESARMSIAWMELAHISESTILVSLLQPAPETYELFYDIILMAEGQIVYHGPKGYIMSFFESCGFKCPERKGSADFLQELAHISESTILVSLLQPAPETYELFDDIILMAEGQIVYHGPKGYIMSFFESCGFKCPERKGSADFLQEVLSKKDQKQYWSRNEEGYNFVTVDQFCDKFKASQSGQNLAAELSKPYEESKGHKNALSFSIYSLSKWDLLKACFARELLLMKRNAFIYISKSIQLGLLAVITGTVFLRTRMGVDRIHANYYMGSLFYALLLLMVNGFPELAMAINRLPVFYKQRDDYFYPAWAYAIPSFILKIPVSLVESIAWTTISYYLIGYTPEASRFFCQLLVLFLIHTVTLSMFRCVASYCQTMVAGSVGGTMAFLATLLFGGFIIPRSFMPNWLKWGFWLSPLSYGEIGLTGNEFLAQRWLEIKISGVALGRRILMDQGLDFSSYFYWISIGALLGFTLLFNVGFAIGLTIKKGRMVLPFTPLIISFQDVNYYVDTPAEMREHGYMEKKLQLLHNITGAFQPGVLSALMGVTGAGKTTLLDVLSGRKTGGVIEGDIRIGGYPKIQQTFARISGYCEQTDVHSPQITVGESVAYSAWLRLPPEVDAKARNEFVNEVLETIELDEIRDSLVGIPGVNGLSTEQRKRLTIAVELVSNPSIIFMDEPTSGLDARAAAIVMRAVKNVADTGRTVVCTIHQPSIDIFEAFDEVDSLTLYRQELKVIKTY
uniref:Pleiotropic drug resistance protein 3 n=1 Tax=Aegilops tauschii TaxID=37682 RepID=M8BEV0_AEGTA